MFSNTRVKIEKSDLDKARLKELIAKFSTARVLVIGDIILDEFLLAKPERISREAPVLILEYLRSNYALGGSGNAANNISALGAKSFLLGLVGSDNAAGELERISTEKNIGLYPLVDGSRSTTVKTRIISTSSSNPDNGTVLQQQVLRVDKQARDEISQEHIDKLFERLESEIDNIDLILLSDYKSGVLTDEVVARIMKLAKSKDKKVIVDTTGDFSKYKGAHILTPNQPDAEETLGYEINSDEDLLRAGQDLLSLIDTEQMLITRGAKGMVLYNQNEETQLTEIPAFNLSEVFDVTGAGDTVAAGLSLAIASGANALEAAIIGNIAASIVVRKYGTATVNQEELIEVIDAL